MLNAPAIIAEISQLHDAYEQALHANDSAALTRFFWDSPLTIRYGVNEHLYGAAAIAEFRQTNRLPITDRQIVRREITAFGPDTASVMCEVSQLVAGAPRRLRQSQLWIRFADVGWKITSAHVSVTPSPATWGDYARQVAPALDLPLDPAHLPGVARHLAVAAALAAPLLAHPLPETTERAAIFTP